MTDKNEKADAIAGAQGLSRSDLARALALSKPRIESRCVVCGEQFSTVVRQDQAHRLYCSERCRKAAYRARKRSQEQEQEPAPLAKPEKS